VTPPDEPAEPGEPGDDAAAGRTHRGVDNVADRLRALGALGSVRMLPAEAKTARQAADGLGCDVGAIANSLIFEADGEPVLILTSGAHRVDTAAVAKRLGFSRLRRASPEFVRDHTGQAIGGVAPIGHPAPLRTFLDRSLAAYPVIWAAAGHAHAVFDTTYAELLRLTTAQEIDVD
jgi:prolyl-tRNA editing enzyme YbaK/EbsC (Cys-tRNA(Pro) deacylase)